MAAKPYAAHISDRGILTPRNKRHQAYPQPNAVKAMASLSRQTESRFDLTKV